MAQTAKRLGDAVENTEEENLEVTEAGRKGMAGDDVVNGEGYKEAMSEDRDESYTVEGTDSPEETATEEVVITDSHEVVAKDETGTQGDVMNDGDGGTEIVDGGATRKGAAVDEEELIMDEDEDEEARKGEADVEIEVEDEDEEERKGSRMGVAGGKDERHQASIRAAVDFTLRDRRL